MTHNIILENRQNLRISGVADVDAFDEEKITVITEEDALLVEGANLHIQKLNIEDGELAIEGEIYSISYSDRSYGGKHKGGLLGRMFK